MAQGDTLSEDKERLDMATTNREEQMFPKLSPSEIDRLRRFGQDRHYAAGTPLFVTGEIAPGMFVLTDDCVRGCAPRPVGAHGPDC